jgi:hypothetical protein
MAEPAANCSRLDVDDRVLDPVAVLEALELRQAAIQRHLPALEPRRDVLTGAGALGATTGGLPATACFTASDADPLLLGALGGLQMMELHTSSTSTR